MWKSFCEEKRKGTPLSVPIIEEKAYHFKHTVGGRKEFQASESWRHRWKSRVSVWQITILDEKLSADDNEGRVVCCQF